MYMNVYCVYIIQIKDCQNSNLKYNIFKTFKIKSHSILIRVKRLTYKKIIYTFTRKICRVNITSAHYSVTGIKYLLHHI